MSEELILQSLNRLEADIIEIKRTQTTYVDKHNELEKQLLLINERQGAITSKQNKLTGGLGWLGWLGAGGLISAVVQWLLKGGLSTSGG